MLGAALLAAILVPFLLALASLAVYAARRSDLERIPLEVEPTPVTELRPPAGSLPSLPVGFRYDAVTPGPLQVVDGEGPTTKICPDCAETVLHSARVCKHCHFRFESPLSGSHAV